MNDSLGRYVYGLAAVGFGLCALVWHDSAGLHQIKALSQSPQRDILASLIGIVQILGGVAVLLRRTERVGAIALGAVYAIIALFGIPAIVGHPHVYNGYGNVLEQFSLAAGAAMLYARTGPFGVAGSAALARAGYYTFGICVLSFGLEQYFYLAATASFVPKWIPPGQMFWADVTTVAFVLAAIALLTGIWALLAARLNAAMILGFGLLVWLPALFADPHTFGNWSEGMETLAIAASAWIVAEYLRDRERGTARLRLT